MSQKILEYEDLVVKAIQDYLKVNRPFDMEKIIPYLRSKFCKSKKININKEGIKKILISLAKKKMIVDGSKFTKTDVLKKSIRKKIYEYIKENPGTYGYKIAKKFKMCNYHVFWHLSVLIKFNFIKKLTINNHEVYFDSNMDLTNANKIYFSSNEKSKKIINYLKVNNCGITKTKLCRDLKFHKKTMAKYIKFLEESNIIFKDKLSNQILYFLEE